MAFINQQTSEELLVRGEKFCLRPAFMTPMPKSEKHMPLPLVSTRKRKFDEAADSSTFDDERYNQHISNDFFKTNVGHDVLQKRERRERDSETKYDIDEMSRWADFYFANRNLFNV